MAFHPRKVLTHLSPKTMAPYARDCSAGVADLIDWSVPDLEGRTLERVLDTDGAGVADLRSALERIDQLSGEAGDRAMVAACGANLDLRQASTSDPIRTSERSGSSTTSPSDLDYAEGIRHADH